MSVECGDYSRYSSEGVLYLLDTYGGIVGCIISLVGLIATFLAISGWTNWKVRTIHEIPTDMAVSQTDKHDYERPSLDRPRYDNLSCDHWDFTSSPKRAKPWIGLYGMALDPSAEATSG